MAKLVPKIRILVGAVVAIGPGKADLLQAIAATGSISAAARQMGMSYRRAWLLMDSANSAFKTPLVETLTGGDGGGGARLTPFGKDVLRRYRRMEARAAQAVHPYLQEFSALLRRRPAAHRLSRPAAGKRTRKSAAGKVFVRKSEI